MRSRSRVSGANRDTGSLTASLEDSRDCGGISSTSLAPCCQIGSCTVVPSGNSNDCTAPSTTSTSPTATSRRFAFPRNPRRSRRVALMWLPPGQSVMLRDRAEAGIGRLSQSLPVLCGWASTSVVIAPSGGKSLVPRSSSPPGSRLQAPGSPLGRLQSSWSAERDLSRHVWGRVCLAAGTRSRESRRSGAAGRVRGASLVQLENV